MTSDGAGGGRGTAGAVGEDSSCPCIQRTQVAKGGGGYSAGRAYSAAYSSPPSIMSPAAASSAIFCRLSAGLRLRKAEGESRSSILQLWTACLHISAEGPPLRSIWGDRAGPRAGPGSQRPGRRRAGGGGCAKPGLWRA